MRRGEIWWANLPNPIGRRPVVLLSRDAAYTVRNAVTVAEITTTIRDIPVEVSLGHSEGMPKKCVANLDTIITIRKGRIDTKITGLPQSKIKEIDEAIRFALDIS
ncbi:MAG: type II toxin-antitoxin system PemK/MazF family toxin [Candidatus Omnitrophota bacterium]|nr:type II toxin-antitoxin system PemK/MazF family toxin [Candidatus Omnitrophota bacterium]MBU3929195.1 type II toxin-antitoxin system PemK/MazF family toxin [bacterium]MBU4123739.1 type II toxin-antitoxin system PemK/MazF family toxin [bacterium]